MADIYLSPKDVNRQDTAAILSFLNSAQTAREIADRIEIAGELDIGIKLGSRLLQARAEANGSFSSLEEIYAVPLIGPERFTEIVITLTGKTPLQVLLAGKISAPTAEVAGITGQIDTLRRLVAELQQFEQRRYRIECKALEKDLYLGETVNLKIRVTDRLNGLSRANIPITIETSQGHLRYAKGYTIQSGTIISARTGVNGQLNCQLYPPTCEPLTESQQVELSRALAGLDDKALLPVDLQEDFQLLASNYRHPLNRDLRAAMDIHYKSRQERLLDTVNHKAALYTWSCEQILVRVYLHPDDERERNTVVAMATLPLSYRDWLLPWYQSYKDDLRKTGELSEALLQALQYSKDEKGLASQMLANMQTFISRQNGLLGERAAQRVSREVAGDFLTQNLEGLSDNSRTTLLTLLREAPSSIKAGSAGQIGVANQVAVDVGRKEGIFDMASQLGNLDSRFNQFDSDLADFRQGVEDFNKTKDLLVTNVVDGVNAALQILEASSPTGVIIKPIDDINLRTTTLSRPPIP